MLQWLKDKWHKRIINHSSITDPEWVQAFQLLPVLQRLNEQEKQKLKHLTILFLHYKSLESGAMLAITTLMRLVIALQACLPILNLGLDWYNGWVSVIIYPGAFSKPDIEIDAGGVVHQGTSSLSGESWQRGPVIVSWDDSLHHGETHGRNVVIHEFAHKLDMQNGRANGLPPLHSDMSVRQWSDVFNDAYEDF